MDNDLLEPTVVYPPAAVTFALIFCILFIILGLVGNGLTILAVLKCRKLRSSPTSVFIISLSITDLLFCAFNLPLTALRYYHQSWVLGEALCKLFPFFFYLNVAASLFNMMAITINRYVLLAHYKSYDRLYRSLNVMVMLMLCWLIPIIILFPTLLDCWGYFGYSPKTFSCTILRDDNGRSPKKFFFLLGFFLPCLVIIVSYCRIFCIVRASRLTMAVHRGKKGSRGQVDEMALTRLVAVIFGSFLLCYLPLMIVNVFDDKDSQPTLHVIGSVLAWSASIINPIIYGAMSARYRQAYRQVLPASICGGKPERGSAGSTGITSATAATTNQNMRLSSLLHATAASEHNNSVCSTVVLTENVES